MTDITVAERSLPKNLEAEKAILGAIIIDNARLSDACEILTSAGMFFRDAHRRIFERMVELGERHEAIDLVTLKEELNRTHELDEVGGPAYISALIDGMPHGTNISHHARIVREKASLRDLIFAGNKMLAKAYASEEEATAILEDAEKAILGLAEGTTSAGFESMRTIAARGLDILERITQSKQAVSGVPSGFTDLDELTRGFQPGTLVTVGARPGVGKTSFAINVAQNAAAAGRVVGVFSLEMSNDELFIRQLSAEARLDSHRLQSGYIGEREWSRIGIAIGTIAESPIHVDETPSIGVFEVRSRARRLKAEHGLDLLIIDYLQLMGSHERRDNRSLEIGAITGALKGLSKELKIPIIVLSQLSRDQEKRGNRPKLSDLRDSGSIEQDSDIVMFLYRPEGDDQPVDQGVTDLIVTKHRNGPVGTVKLSWFGQQTRFANFSEFPEPEDQRLPMGDR